MKRILLNPLLFFITTFVVGDLGFADEVKMIPHPGAAQGLQRINKDGSYQYKVPLREKSQSTSVRFSSMSTPKIDGGNGNTYDALYGSSRAVGLLIDYDWQPFRGFGSLGLQLGVGIFSASGHGVLQDGAGTASEESYTLYMVPLSAFLVYRFEYVRRQWIVPFIAGGGTLYGLAERRDDGKKPTFASASAAGGGGGVHFSISRLDPHGAFTLDRDYGIADMWLTLEARVMQGLRSDIDFTNTEFSAGITVDY
ncbi:MAG: hypothetical protein BroJett040_04210 [Oligoflexia bacterium]|nr:MAG: hypothetical protein BroJett040_04210 [Oligoflexia bacterium]